MTLTTPYLETWHCDDGSPKKWVVDVEGEDEEVILFNCEMSRLEEIA